MKNQSWSISSKNHVDYGDDDEEQQQPVKNDEPEEDEEEQQTLKPTHAFQSARQTMIERKMQAADARGQTLRFSNSTNFLSENNSRKF